jgi:ABC-type uncharacterized transport system substrate-binding protein
VQLSRFNEALAKRACLLSVIAVLLGGCAFQPPAVSVVETPVEAPAPAPTPAPAPPAPTQPAPPPIPPEPARPAPPVRTALLLSDDIPAFSAIAEEIVARVGNAPISIHNLDGNPANVSRIRAEAAEADRLIAVGLFAASVAREIEGKPLVFCQVFNYQDHDLISASSKGVKLLPPFDLQLDAWLELAPGLKRIGIIVGPGQEQLVEEIRTATQARQIELAVQTVQSDKEALYNFKRMTQDIEGLWLLPDNRVLSPEVVREIMSYSARHRTQVVVFGANLLDLGALVSVKSDPGDIAERVLERLADVGSGEQIPGPDMQSLTMLDIDVNAEVARYLGLNVVPQSAPSLAQAP